MLCGRPAIAHDAGGIAELLVDNETGFLAAAATVGALDAALERAWRSLCPTGPGIGAQAAAAYARAHCSSPIPRRSCLASTYFGSLQ
jgi:glycosyltransferase involved in cell wall biosynthesis